jgi:hypothetical protein
MRGAVAASRRQRFASVGPSRRRLTRYRLGGKAGAFRNPLAHSLLSGGYHNRICRHQHLKSTPIGVNVGDLDQPPGRNLGHTTSLARYRPPPRGPLPSYAPSEAISKVGFYPACLRSLSRATFRRV